MDSNLLNILLIIAVKMTQSGAEISRVEESLYRMCMAYNCKSCDIFATTSQIIATVQTPYGEFITIQKRVGTITTDIEKLDRLNNLVRNITSSSPDAKNIKLQLQEAESTKTASKYTVIFSYGIIAASFCLFFGERKTAEISVAFAVGIAVGLLSLLFEKLNFNKILARFLCSFFAAVIVKIFLNAKFISNPDCIIIGNIMSLIPGIGLTNALRDLFTGDMITGTLRSIEALLLTIAIAIGFALPSLLTGGAF